MAAQELRWLTYLLTILGEWPRSPPVLYVDNKAAIALCQEHRLEHITKHIALRYFLARELQQRGQLRLTYVATRANTADIFTKALPPGDHQQPRCPALQPASRAALPCSREPRRLALQPANLLPSAPLALLASCLRSACALPAHTSHAPRAHPACALPVRAAAAPTYAATTAARAAAKCYCCCCALPCLAASPSSSRIAQPEPRRPAALPSPTEPPCCCCFCCYRSAAAAAARLLLAPVLLLLSYCYRCSYSSP
ncbi:unnamed protein product [Closterium sp. NIES-53]